MATSTQGRLKSELSTLEIKMRSFCGPTMFLDFRNYLSGETKNFRALLTTIIQSSYTTQEYLHSQGLLSDLKHKSDSSFYNALSKLNEQFDIRVVLPNSPFKMPLAFSQWNQTAFPLQKVRIISRALDVMRAAKSILKHEKETKRRQSSIKSARDILSLKPRIHIQVDDTSSAPSPALHASAPNPLIPMAALSSPSASSPHTMDPEVIDIISSLHRRMGRVEAAMGILPDLVKRIVSLETQIKRVRPTDQK
eukprot:gnl/Dysnectes_brevis/5846_a8675_593.p1 GENE.gnl/Dysnectes_brevis/5846_a8675_593~~gnl/Dysnectes_brevis/5846_a8675_593.p1  ORF type:complete len:260 (+),score=0.87 gnl/Dysnectes_brevis/5846_a8675_593:28-780(+)